jgi:hypothetical protein
MSTPVSELEGVLATLIIEHRRLLRQLIAQHDAMETMDLKAIESATAQQEALRLRIATLENRRQTVTAQLAAPLRVTPPITLLRLIDALPRPQQPTLRRQRDELRTVMQEISRNAGNSGRLAGAVLGYLNTAVRLLNGAIQRSGVYTRQGLSRATPRLGVMDAVG